MIDGRLSSTGARRASSVLRAAAAIALVSVALAGCGSVSETVRLSSKKPEIDPKLGVSPSPRVVADGQPVPKGGGRSMVGKPYRVAGKTYVPRHDPDYRAVGMASWYGDAFHGRRTANGEVFDANHLSAAHPTMPLPSYARVTSVDTGRSVIVRVNDRGPFHSNRVLDMSRRTAEMLGIRSKGVAKVQVAYVGPAPVHGDDTPYLMASYSGPSNVPVGMPETMVASATPKEPTTSLALPGVLAKILPSASTPEPVVAASMPAVQPAVETATAAPQTVSVAALPPARPMVFEAYAVVASVDPADVLVGGAPVVVAAADLPVSPLGWQVGAQPVGYQSVPASATVDGFGFDTKRPAASVGPSSSFAAERVASAYAAVDDVGGAGIGLADLTRDLQAMATGSGPSEPAAVVQVGVFADPANARRIAEALGDVGTLRLDELRVDGRNLTRVRIVALANGRSVEDAVRAAEQAGARGALALR